MSYPAHRKNLSHKTCALARTTLGLMSCGCITLMERALVSNSLGAGGRNAGAALAGGQVLVRILALLVVCCEGLLGCDITRSELVTACEVYHCL